MDSEIKTWLFDIIQSINEIESYFIDKPKKFEDYSNDIKTKRAIERDIEIIGEAIHRIIKKDNNFEIENAQKLLELATELRMGTIKFQMI